MVRARFVPAALAALLVLVVGGSATAAEQSARASAGAYGVQVLVPEGAGGGAGAVAAPPESSAALDGYAYGDGAVSTGGIATSGRAGSAETRASAAGRASVQAVSLFGGEITADTAVAKATARASATGAAGSLGASSLTNLVVLGKPVDPAPNLRVKLADWGYAVLLEQAVVRQTDRRHGFRGFVTALHVVLTAEHGGLPAGSEITVGYAEAAATAPKPPPPPPPPPERQDDSDRPPREPVPEPPGADPEPPPVVQDPPADVRPQLTAGGYVFPVYGPVSFTDDFAAARAITGWHHGNDIFASLGAPVLAVTDGTLFLVGWNTIGGNRFWLRDLQGNEFYYAHLSAFTP
ncbi:MAG: choice-of-anchor P family protein, partial [Gaiellaceae bacterium]